MYAIDDYNISQTMELSGTVTNISFSLLGASWILFLNGIAQAFVVFENRSSKIFLFCVFGLVCGIVEIMLTTSTMYWGTDTRIISIAVAPFWFFMIQCATWAYCLRIKALGGFMSRKERYIMYIPWLVFIIQIPADFFFVFSMFLVEYYRIFLIATTVFSVLIAIIEIFLYFILLRKMLEILEYRKRLKTVLAFEMTVSLIVVVMLDILLIISKTMNTKLDLVLRPFTYILRIVVLIRFFSDLLGEIQRNSYSRISNRPTELKPGINFVTVDRETEEI